MLAVVGIGRGETRTVNASFPQNYLSANLAGKAASFQVTAKSIEVAGKVTGDTKTEVEGKAEKAAGKVQNTIGGVKDSLRGK